VFGERAEVQRCQNSQAAKWLKEHLPEEALRDTDGRIRNAYAMTSYADAKRNSGKSSGNWTYQSQWRAHSLERRLEETLTVHRLGVGTCCGKRWLQQSHRVCFHRGKSGPECERWRPGITRCAGRQGLLKQKKNSAGVKGYRELELLQRKTEPVVDSAGPGRVTCPPPRVAASTKLGHFHFTSLFHPFPELASHCSLLELLSVICARQTPS